jgi:hypothetical protein
MSSRPGSEPDQDPLIVEGSPLPEEPVTRPDVPPLIRRAHEAFRRDLPRLLEEQPGRWAAYHGDERIGVAPTKAELYQECLRLGLKRGEFLVRSIEPEQGEVVMGPGIPEVDIPVRGG